MTYLIEKRKYTWAVAEEITQDQCADMGWRNFSQQRQSERQEVTEGGRGILKFQWNEK